MVDLKKILRKAFGKTSLKNEDWLEPSSGMLEQIEARIYTKKKSRGWLFLIPAFLLVLLIGGWWFGTRSTLTEEPGAHNLASTKTETLIPETATPENIASVLTTNELQSTDKEVLSLIKEENQNPIILDKTNPKKIVETSTKKMERYTEKFANREHVLRDQQLFSTQNNFIDKNKNTVEERVVKTQYFPLENVSVIPSEVTTIQTKLSTLIILSTLTKLDGPRLFTVTGSPTQRSAPPIKVIVPKSTWSIVAGASASFWQFKLNDAYRTALAPADFQSSNGAGVRTFVGLDKKLGCGFSLGMKLAYERISFSSGHNSVLDYNRDEETDMDHSNSKMVRMATPVGFVESDLVINRENDIADAQVLIDIKNRHQIQSLDWQLNLDYAFPQILGLSPTVNVGAGVNYIVKLTNELNSFTPIKTDFSAGKGAIIAGQSSLLSWSPTITTGFGIEKNITKNLSIGVNGNYLFNLNVLQEMDDFSTRVNRFNGGVYLRRNF